MPTKTERPPFRWRYGALRRAWGLGRVHAFFRALERPDDWHPDWRLACRNGRYDEDK